MGEFLPFPETTDDGADGSSELGLHPGGAALAVFNLGKRLGADVCRLAQLLAGPSQALAGPFDVAGEDVGIASFDDLGDAAAGHGSTYNNLPNFENGRGMNSQNSVGTSCRRSDWHEYLVSRNRGRDSAPRLSISAGYE